jgi:hypothetical protein
VSRLDTPDNETGIVNQLRDGTVEVAFRGMQPFEMPPDAAIRFAALLCKRAGCEVMFRDGSMKIKFPRGFQFLDKDEVAEKAN